MRIGLILVAFMASFTGMAQPAAEALTKDNKTLQERYIILKSKSQTYNDYKVIKEVILDGMWRVILDSVSLQKTTIKEAQANIAGLQTEVNKLKSAMDEKEKGMAEMVHDSTHIDVMGIPFHKAAFLSGTGLIVAGLIVGLLSVIGRMKLQNKTLSEKSLALNALIHEFEDYRQRAMDKQTKLSRELQDERNKLYGMRSS